MISLHRKSPRPAPGGTCPICGSHVWWATSMRGSYRPTNDAVIGDHIRSEHQVTVEAEPGYGQTREEVGQMHARVRFGHDRFHEVARKQVGINEVRDGAWRVLAVHSTYEITYEENSPNGDGDEHLELDRNGDAWLVQTTNRATTRTRLVPANEED